MTTSLKMFLMVAEEMSFSSAAERAYVTQQCLSDHVKRLEHYYGVPLFNRKPRLSLTLAGEALLQSVYQLQVFENSIDNTIEEIKGGRQGKLNFGLNYTRARVLLPTVITRYTQMFPNVEITVNLDDTANMEEMLVKGKIDLLLGANTSNNPIFHKECLWDENVYLIISNKFLSQRFSGVYPACKEKFRQGVDLKWFERVPVIRNLQVCALTTLLDQHAARHNIQLNTVLAISDYDVQITLCSSGLAAAFCPTMLLERVFEINKQKDEEEQINIFPIIGLEKSMRIDFLYLENNHCPKYITKFMELIRDEMDKFSHVLAAYGLA